MAVTTVVKTIGQGGDFSTVQLWHDGAPANLVTAERSACGTFAVAKFIQGETLTFVGSGATGKFLDSDSTGAGNGTYVTYGITAGNPATADVITGSTSLATAILTSGTPDFTGIVWQGQCKFQEFTVNGTVLTVSGGTTSAAAYKELTTVAGASFRDAADVAVNPLCYDAEKGAALNSTAAGGTVIACTENNFRLSKLQLTGSNGTSRCLNFSGTGTFIDSCILDGSAVAAGATAGPFVFPSTSTVRNCVLIGRGDGADHIIQTATGSPNFYNCTIVAPINITGPTSIFASGASGTVTVQNCGLFAGDASKAIKAGSATYVFTTCVSDISGTANVTQVTYGNEYKGIVRESMDLRLSRTSLQIDTGTTDSINAATDIVGTSRPQQAAYDIGAWESAFTTSSGSITPTQQRRRRGSAHDAASKCKH